MWSSNEHGRATREGQCTDVNDGPIGDARLELDSPRAIAQVIDDEVVAINLETGTYYSLRGSAAAIWSLLLEGHTVGDTAGRLGMHVAAEPGAIRIETERFATDLVAEGLLRRAASPGEGGLQRDVDALAGLPGGVATDGAGRIEFESPCMERFTDMEDLLMFDPVHDVSGEGWPHVGPPPDREG
jgi:Coenzyme PQQ synthesis protein D (PqqD)